MTGREWIEQITEILDAKAKKIEKDTEALERLKTDIFGITALMYDVDRVQTFAEGDKLAKQYIKIEELDRRITSQEKDYIAFREKAIVKIRELVPDERLAKVVIYRHIFFMTKGEIAQDLSLSESGVAKRFEKAYNLLNSIYILEKYRKKIDSIPRKVVL